MLQAALSRLEGQLAAAGSAEAAHEELEEALQRAQQAEQEAQQLRQQAERLAEEGSALQVGCMRGGVAGARWCSRTFL